MDRARIIWHRARHFAANISHMTKHAGPSHNPAITKDRQDNELIIIVTNRAFTGIRVIEQDYIALFNITVKASKKTV